jgi:hypothetical protein
MMSLNSPSLTKLLVVLLLLTAAVFATPLVRLPGHNQGYSPEQPIHFKHSLHAGELGIDCQYCHFTAERGPHAGFPAVATCLNCHRYVKGSTDYNQAEIAKLWKYAGLDENGQPDPKATPQPIPWVKIHTLPAFVRFDHSRHVTQKLACQTCHGPIQTMDQVAQKETLSMGFCVNCHRDAAERGIEGVDGKHHVVHPAIDCAVCHY